MENEAKYIRLTVAGAKKMPGGNDRCFVRLVPGGENTMERDAKEIVFFCDNHDAARIVMAAFPEKMRHIPRIQMWTDLMREALAGFGVTIEYVEITRSREGMLESTVACSRTGDPHLPFPELEIESNIVDGVLLAFSQSRPLIIARSLYDSIPDLRPAEKRNNVPLSELPKQALIEMLHDAVGREDYMAAAKLRDELKKRSGNKADS